MNVHPTNQHKHKKKHAHRLGEKCERDEDIEDLDEE